MKSGPRAISIGRILELPGERQRHPAFPTELAAWGPAARFSAYGLLGSPPASCHHDGWRPRPKGKTLEELEGILNAAEGSPGS